MPSRKLYAVAGGNMSSKMKIKRVVAESSSSDNLDIGNPPKKKASFQSLKNALESMQ